MNVKTPLNAWHHAHGGRMVDFAGAELPVLFTSIVQKHQAVRADAGWFDVSHMGRFLLKGPGAVAWLEKLATCKVTSIVKRQVRYGLMCQEGGGVLDDFLVYRHEDGWGLVVNASNRRKIFSWLLQHRENLDADLHDQSDATAMCVVQGLRAISLGREIFANDP